MAGWSFSNPIQSALGNLLGPSGISYSKQNQLRELLIMMAPWALGMGKVMFLCRDTRNGVSQKIRMLEEESWGD